MVNSGGAERREPAEDEVLVGEIKGPWGLRGDVNVKLLTDSPSRFSPGSILFLDGEPARIERSRPIRSGLRVKLDTVNDRTRAELLAGRLLTVPQRDVAPLPKGTYYHFQIIDMGVWSDDGQYLGDVKEILNTGGNDVYVVRDSANNEVLIPALDGVVLEVDVPGSRMTVRLPEGLR